MAIVTVLCVSILLLCDHLVNGNAVVNLENPDLKAMMRKLDELQDVINVQKDRISVLEARDKMTDIEELRKLGDTVNNQKKRISVLEKKYLDLENFVTTQAKELVKQKELGEEKSNKIFVMQNRLSIFEKQNERTETRLTKLIRSVKGTKDTMKAFTFEDNAKEQNLIRKERLLIPETGPPPVDNIAVAFYAYLSNHVMSPGGHYILAFDTVITNTGNAYHPHSGSFIAPRSSLYVFTWTIRMWGTSHHSTELLVNNNVVGITYYNPNNTVDGSVSGTVVVHVNQGDDALLRTDDVHSDGHIISNSAGRSSFAGWFLI